MSARIAVLGAVVILGTAARAASAASPELTALDRPTSLLAPEGEFEALAFASNGRTLVGFRAGRGLEVMDWPSGRRLASLPIAHPRSGFLAISPEGTTAASGPDQKSLVLWRPPAPDSVRTIEAQGLTIEAVVFSPDGRRLATGGHDGGVRVWDSASLGLERELSGHFASITALAFSPDGGRLATAAGDNDVCVWNAATGELVHRLSSLTHSVFATSTASGVSRGERTGLGSHPGCGQLT